MPRDVVIPQQAYTEEFMAIIEHPGQVVRATVGVLRADGKSFDVERYRPREFEIAGEDFELLTGPETPLLPGKPAGTYRNEDLWYFVDKLRNSDA